MTQQVLFDRKPKKKSKPRMYFPEVDRDFTYTEDFWVGKIKALAIPEDSLHNFSLGSAISLVNDRAHSPRVVAEHILFFRRCLAARPDRPKRRGRDENEIERIWEHALRTGRSNHTKWIKHKYPELSDKELQAKVDLIMEPEFGDRKD